MPKGAVELTNERPSVFAICVKTGPGKGKWVEPSWLKTQWLKLKGQYYARMPIYKVRLRILAPVLFSVLLVTVPGVLVFNGNEAERQSYWMAIVTSFVVTWGFYFINVSFPKRKRALFEASRVQTLLARLIQLKDAQYRILGFRNDDESHIMKPEDGMNGNKARVLIDLMRDYDPNMSVGHHSQCLGGYARLPYTNTLSGHFDASHKLFLHIFEELKEVVKPELFPKFYRALVRMDEQLKYKKAPYLPNLFNRPEDYEAFHFRLIEYIECLYEMECVPFVIYTPVERGVYMKFDATFKLRASNPRAFSWDLRWPKVGDGIWFQY